MDVRSERGRSRRWVESLHHFGGHGGDPASSSGRDSVPGRIALRAAWCHTSSVDSESRRPVCRTARRRLSSTRGEFESRNRTGSARFTGALGQGEPRHGGWGLGTARSDNYLSANAPETEILTGQCAIKGKYAKARAPRNGKCAKAKVPTAASVSQQKGKQKGQQRPTRPSGPANVPSTANAPRLLPWPQGQHQTKQRTPLQDEKCTFSPTESKTASVPRPKGPAAARVPQQKCQQRPMCLAGPGQCAEHGQCALATVPTSKQTPNGSKSETSDAPSG